MFGSGRNAPHFSRRGATPVAKAIEQKKLWLPKVTQKPKTVAKSMTVLCVGVARVAENQTPP
jgi:hypothetical protein